MTCKVGVYPLGPVERTTFKSRLMTSPGCTLGSHRAMSFSRPACESESTGIVVASLCLLLLLVLVLLLLLVLLDVQRRG